MSKITILYFFFILINTACINNYKLGFYDHDEDTYNQNEIMKNDGNDMKLIKNNQYNDNQFSNYHKSLYYYDGIHSKPFENLMKDKSNQALTIKRDILNQHTNESNNQQNDRDLSNTFINNTINDAKTAKTPNLLLPMVNNNNNSTNELEDLKEILNQIYEELDTIKASKMCMDKNPDGNDCDVNGVWNAVEIGLRIELSTLLAIDGNKLVVNLTEKIPKKPTYRIDTMWKCSGSIVHKNGGPFYFHCMNHQSPQSMTIFHGICKKCSGFDTIFGEWMFQHIPNDCRQIWTYSETKRDVFHKNIVHHSKTSRIDNANSNQTAADSMNKNNDSPSLNQHKYRRNSNRFQKFTQNINQDLFFNDLN